MNRHIQTMATVLSTRQIGESNRLVTLLTEDEGLVRAVLYGGSKSRLRTLVSPYHNGKIWLYKNPQKDSIKITDFDVKNFYLSLREELYKAWAASVCAEVLITTHSGGEAVDFKTIFDLTCGFFTGLDIIKTEFDARMGLARFLWRYLALLGLQPESHFCVHCGEDFEKVDRQTTVHHCSFYAPADLGFVCSACAKEYHQRHYGIAVSEKTRSYLAAISTKTPAEVRLLPVSETVLKELQELIFYLIEKACGIKLKSLI